jgi:hypothetical protein
MTPQPQSPYTTHDDVWSLLPWYANGSLDTGETARVKSHLQVCLVCRKELAAQHALAHRLRHSPKLEISTKPSFERLLARIQADATPAPAAQQPRSRPVASRFGGLAHWVGALAAPRWVVAFAMALVALVLPAVVQEYAPMAVQRFHTVANPGSLDAFTKNDIRVIFAAPVTKAQIETLLKSVHGTLVQGPIGSGVYTVRIQGAEPSGQSAALAIGRLRADKTVVLAEPALPWEALPGTRKE